MVQALGLAAGGVGGLVGRVGQVDLARQQREAGAVGAAAPQAVKGVGVQAESGYIDGVVIGGAGTRPVVKGFVVEVAQQVEVGAAPTQHRVAGFEPGGLGGTTDVQCRALGRDDVVGQMRGIDAKAQAVVSHGCGEGKPGVLATLGLGQVQAELLAPACQALQVQVARDALGTGAARAAVVGLDVADKGGGINQF